MSARLRSWAGLIILWLLALFTTLAVRTLIPVDETRYATVAWEMWQRGDFLVPHLNGQPYSHKPPLFFWLIHAGWWLTGVHEWVVRAIAPLLTLATLLATGRLARCLWPQDDATAAAAPWVLFSCVFLTAIFSWVQIDMLMVLCVVLAMTGLVTAARGALAGWLLTGAALGLGLLAKGPVVLVYVLPVALLLPFWSPGTGSPGWWRWSAGLATSLMIAALIALAWVLPAVQAGGADYREAILWGQTANRVVHSFAHAHPLWWYLPWLGVLFAPWIYLPWLWAGVRQSRPAADAGLRLCLVWIASTFILLSLVSGKQLKYLLPMLPAFALLVARVLTRMDARPVNARPWLLGALLFCAGAALAVLPYVLEWFEPVHPVWGVFIMAAAVVLVALQPARPAQYPALMTLLSVYVVSMIHLGVMRPAAPAYDLRAASRLIATAQAAGRAVAVTNRYHGEFGFYGRLTQPVDLVTEDRLREWALQHPDGYLVMVDRDDPAGHVPPVFTQPYQNGRLAIVEGRVITAQPGMLP
ncbi:MAG: glycosyltransferase family 39 protein [Gammaproteobacteria bacterium]